MSTAADSGLYMAFQEQLCHSAQWLNHKQFQRPKNFNIMMFTVFSTRILQHDLGKCSEIDFLGFTRDFQELTSKKEGACCVPRCACLQTNDCLSTYGLNNISRFYHHDPVVKWVSGMPGSSQCIKAVVLSLAMIIYCMSGRLNNSEQGKLEILKRH